MRSFKSYFTYHSLEYRIVQDRNIKVAAAYRVCTGTAWKLEQLRACLLRSIDPKVSKTNRLLLEIRNNACTKHGRSDGYVVASANLQKSIHDQSVRGLDCYFWKLVAYTEYVRHTKAPTFGRTTISSAATIIATYIQRIKFMLNHQVIFQVFAHINHY